MYLHLGNNTIVQTENIIGIFDLDSSTVSLKTREFLGKAEKNGNVVVVNVLNVSSELPKSFVLCREGDKTKIYICRLSPVTLIRRVSNISITAD